MLDRLYDSLRDLTPPNARRWLRKQPWFIPVTKAAFGTAVYSKSYYRDIERLESDSVRVVAEWIVDYLRPTRVIDVGCGPGHLMQALEALGTTTVGVDIADAALALCAQKRLDVVRFDLTGPGSLPGVPYDLAVSCEVAEHLEERFAAGFVEKLAEAAPVVYLTAAEPGSGGLHHYNEQPNDYWIELMRARGMALDEEATRSARERFASRAVIGYLARPMIFRRAADVASAS
ncbi:MAG TPA: methyltransferase [Gammaproteobacteria bacterium]